MKQITWEDALALLENGKTVKAKVRTGNGFLTAIGEGGYRSEVVSELRYVRHAEQMRAEYGESNVVFFVDNNR